jgi:DnaK suppressor protein
MAKPKQSSAAGAASGNRRGSSSESARTSRKAGPAKAIEAQAARKTSGGSRSARKPKSAPTPGQATKTAAKNAATSKPTAAKKTIQGSGSVRTKTAARTATATPSAKAPEAPAYEPPPEIPKTKLTDKQLDEFRQLLLEKRHELVGDVDNLANEALRRSRGEASGDLSRMPIHMADIGTDNWEQEFTLGLIDNEQALLKEIDQALRRIEDRTYGVCLGTHKRIAVARLRAKPWAKYCIEYARLREQGRAPQG